MSRAATCLIIMGSLLLAPWTARGQGGLYGSIVGYVIDQTGAPIKGVKVVAESPTQVGGAKTTYTNDEGNFHFLLLQPGSFEVRASAPKLHTHIEKDIKVGINAPAELNIVMEVETAVEEVKVVQRPPVVSTTTANLKEDFDVEFVQSLPMTDRDDIFSQLVNEVGGGINGGIRGGTSSQTLITQDGFDMRGQYPSLKSTAAFEIQTGGYGAQNATASGGLVNLVSKSGSNRFEFEVNATADASFLQFFKDGTDSTTPTHIYLLNPTISGPIVKDRLWFAFNTEIYYVDRGRDKDSLGYFPDPAPYINQYNKGTLKLTWQVTNRNKVSTVTIFDRPRTRNEIDGLGVDPDAQQNRQTERWFNGVIWESLLSDSVVFRSQVGYIYFGRNIFPSRCVNEPIVCDHIPSVQNNFPRTQQLNNRNYHERMDLDSFQFQNRLEWFASTRNFGEHNFVLHDRFFTEQQDDRISHPGDQFTQYNGLEPQQITYYYANDPRYEAPRYGWWIGSYAIYRHLGTVSDSWRLTRYLTLTPALSHVWGTGSNSTGDTLAASSTFAPSMALAWDATHDGRTVVRSSFNTYVDVDFAAIASHTLGSQTSQTCRWNASSGAYDSGCTYSGGLSKNTFGLPCGPSGINPDGSNCREAVGIPRTWEYTFGGEREIVQGLALSTDLTYRKFLNQFNVHETNQIWNASATALDPVAGYRNGRNETINDLETPEPAQRRYAGVTLGIKKREGRLKIFTYYTLSVLQGNVFGQGGGYGRPGRDVYLYGYLNDDHRHEIKTNLVYQFTRWLSTGVRYDYISGRPYNRLYRNDVSGSFEDYRAVRGTDPGGNINDPGTSRSLRLPDLQSVNASVRVNWLPLIGQRLETYADILNVMALRTVTAVSQNDGPAFGTPTDRKGPMTVRLGINYRY